MDTGVWVFNGEGSHLPSAVFSTVEEAEIWITRYRLSGILTWYPLNISVYDWVLAKGYFQLKSKIQSSPEFISRFTSAYTGHHHYENGIRQGISTDD
jgi:hypothetical protein